MCDHLDGVECLMGCVVLGICTYFWSSACVFISGCVLGLDTNVLECILLFLYCSMLVSVCLGGFSAITDVFADYLTGFHNRLHPWAGDTSV